MSESPSNIVEVQDAVVRPDADAEHAVLTGLSLQINRGEILGLAGEAGSGKTALLRSLIGLSRISAGDAAYYCDDGQRLSLTQPSAKDRAILRQQLQYVFPEPMTALSPYMTVAEIVAEPLLYRKTTGNIDMQVNAALQVVGLDPRHRSRYPRSFRRADLQRLAIARALVCEPRLLLLDEPMRELDVTVQAQLLNLLLDLQETRGLTIVIGSRDMTMLEQVTDRIAVLYAGSIVEMTGTRELFEQPKHPYTRIWLAALPMADPEYTSEAKVLQEARNGGPIGAGCPFRPRCPLAIAQCAGENPKLTLCDGEHTVRCHAVNAAAAKVAAAK